MILRACFDRLGGRNVGRKVDAKYNLGSWLRASVFMGTLGDRIFTRVLFPQGGPSIGVYCGRYGKSHFPILLCIQIKEPYWLACHIIVLGPATDNHSLSSPQRPAFHTSVYCSIR